MKSPLKNLEMTTVGGVTQDYKAHINSGGIRAQYPGCDFYILDNPKQEAYAIESGTIYNLTDGYGNNYIMLYGTTGIWFYVHLSKFLKVGGSYVTEGQVIAKCGQDGGYSFGYHLHIGLLRNGVYVDPQPYLLSFLKMITKNHEVLYRHLVSNKNCPFNPKALSLEQFPEWFSKHGERVYFERLGRLGRSDVTKAATAGMDLLTWAAISGVEEYPKSIFATESEAQKVKKVLTSKFEEATKKLQEVIEEKESILEGNNKLLEENKKLIENHKQELEDVIVEFEKKNIVIDRQEVNESVGIIAKAIIEEVKSRGIKQKWHEFVDKHFRSDYIKSLLKYDWVVIISIALTAFIGFGQNIQAEEGTIVAVLVSSVLGISSQLLKYLITNNGADRNKDGKIDVSDILYTDLESTR